MNKYIPVIVGLIIVAIAMGWIGLGSIVGFGTISGQGLTNEVKTIQWQGLNVDLQSAYFGEQTSGKADKRTVTTSTGGTRTEYIQHEFCGDSSYGAFTINNDFSVSSSLILSSDFQASRDCHGDSNYITATLTIPAGKILTLNYDLQTQSSDRTGAYSFSRIKTTGLEFEDSVQSCDSQFTGCNSPSLKSGTKQFYINESKQVTIALLTSTSQGSSKSNSAVKIDLINQPTVSNTENQNQDSSNNQETSTTTTQNPDTSESTTEQNVQTSTSFIQSVINWFKNLIGGLFG